MLEPIIFDGRNLLADLNLERLDFQYYGLGFSNQ